MIKGKESLIVKPMEGKYGGFSGAEIECVVNSVFEKKFIEYIQDAEKHSNELDYKPEPRIIKVDDFTTEIENIKHSVMAEQVSTPCNNSNINREKTCIERIRDMQRTYKFTVATIGNDVPDRND